MKILNVPKSFESILDSPYGIEILKRAWEMHNRGEDVEPAPEDMFQKQIWQLEAQMEWDLYVNIPTWELSVDEILPFVKLEKETQEQIFHIGWKLKEKYLQFKKYAKYELVYEERTLRDVL